MRVRHFGNTANNAFHNALLLAEYEGIESELPISMFGGVHAMSAPAWEVIDFEVPDSAWVPTPDWSLIAEAADLNGRYSDLPRPASPEEPSTEGAPISGRQRPLPGLRRWVNGYLPGKRWAQPLFDYSTRQRLSRRVELPEDADVINIVYGADSLERVRIRPGTTHSVCLEHGTIRWVADGAREQSVARRAYRQQVESAAHLWVTNLDPRTLEIAEDVAHGKWSAIPHPFVPDPRVPFAESGRDDLLRRTASEYLVLLPSSQNWSPHHDKGSMKALSAFVELRRAGFPVGLVAVEWGLQLAESKAFLAASGVGDNVAWVAPMARFALQRRMADADVVWDQFGLDAFGALALRAVEQGTPFVSRGLAPEGERLIGGPVPWLHATTVDDIVRQTRSVFEEMSVRGRAAVVHDFRTRYRSWLLERHSPAITAALQADVYGRMLDGTFVPGTSEPDSWARLIGDRPERGLT